MSAGSTFSTVDAQFAQLRKLTEIGRALTYSTSLEQVTRLTVERGADLLDASAAVLMLTDTDGLLQVVAAHGIPEERVARFRAPLEDEVVGRVQVLLEVPDERFIAVPLFLAGAVRGLVAVTPRQPVTAADETLLSALADQAAVALENARLGGEVRLELEQRLRASEGATTAKDRALATLAHDIRTPLGAIDAYCAILQEEIHGPVNDRQRETLGRVRASGRHLLSLLDNVMEMARLTAGVLRVDAEPVSLADVAREAVHMLIPGADARLQTLQFARHSDIVVTADHARVCQVLLNLIGNAVKFTPEGGSVTVDTFMQTIDGASWGAVSVTDSGPGIADAEKGAIFEPYYRSEDTALVAGVGLGLTISQALVEHMAGELEVESQFGAGSRFIVRFPVADGPSM